MNENIHVQEQYMTFNDWNFLKNASLKWIWKVLIKNIPFNCHMQAQKSENIYIKRNCVILQNWSLCTLFSEHEKIRVLFSPMRRGIFLG